MVHSGGGHLGHAGELGAGRGCDPLSDQPLGRATPRFLRLRHRRRVAQPAVQLEKVAVAQPMILVQAEIPVMKCS